MTRDDVMQLAEQWIGTPYRHQASEKGAGCDCLGLIRGVWRDLYGREPEEVPAYAEGWAEAGAGEILAQAFARHMREVPVEEAGAGDVLLFRWRRGLPAKHAAIHAGGGMMIHAQDKERVAAAHINEYWKKRLTFAFRFPGMED